MPVTISGTLNVSNGASSVAQTLLAVQGGLPDAIGAATQFVTGKGLRDGQAVDATGDRGTLGARRVLFLGNVEAASLIRTVRRAQPTKPFGAASKRARAKTARKKPTGKKPARTTRTRKSGRSKK